MGFRFRPMGLLVAEKILGGTIDGEEIVLAGADGLLRSDNYDPGVAGWAIDGDGDAELNSVTVRGTVDASTITASDIQGGTISGSRIEGSSVIVGAKLRSINKVDNSAGGGNAIESTTFTSGSDGWQIAANGDAEFNSVVVRGTVDASTITASTITGSTIHAGGVVEISDAADGIRIVPGGGSTNGVKWADSNSVEMDAHIRYDDTAGRMYFIVSSGNRFEFRGFEGTHVGIGGTAPTSYALRLYGTFGLRSAGESLIEDDLDVDGDLGVGIRGPFSSVKVRINGPVRIDNGLLFVTSKRLNFSGPGASNTDEIEFTDSDNTFHFEADSGDCDSRTAAGEYAVASSSRLNKTNIADHQVGLDELRRLRPVEFDVVPASAEGPQPRDADGRFVARRPTVHRLGFVAEEIDDINPHLAARDGDGEVFGWNVPGMVSLLTRSVQDLADRVDALEEAA